MRVEIETDEQGNQIFNGDGTPRLHYQIDEGDIPEGGGAIWTGPAKGIVTTADGTTYDVTPPLIFHLAGHLEEIDEAIRQQHIASGLLTE